MTEPVSPHELRAGFVTTAYRNGVPDEEIMGHTRHRSLTTMRSYVRRAKLSNKSPAVTWKDGVPLLRMLQVDELKAAMGFRPEYKLDRGSRRDRIRLLGNGVCPPMMRRVIENLRSSESAQLSAKIVTLNRHDQRRDPSKLRVYAQSQRM